MKPVRLSQQLVLESATRSPDGAGGYTETWAPLGILCAEIRAMAGQERSAVAGTLSYVPFRMIVRAAPQGAASRPVVDQRFRDGARIFRIYAVAEYQGKYLQCFTKEEVTV